MMPPHPHPSSISGALSLGGLVTLALVLLVAAAYLAAAGRLRRRGDRWPLLRDVSFMAGAVTSAGAAAVLVPGRPFTSHVAQHLLAAMVAPLLLILARPLTLTLRVLPPGRARRALVGVAHARPFAWLLCPATAAVLNVAGLWLLYRTPLFAVSQQHPLLHAAVHVHMVAAGLLLTAALCQTEPVRHRWSVTRRGGTLLFAGAAHAVLAKSLYATGPPGTSYAGPDLQAGAQLMYYGGDAVEVAIAVVLAVQWYAVTGREHLRMRRAAAATAPHGM